MKVTRRDIGKGLIAGAVAAAIRPAWSFPRGGAAISARSRYLGVNLEGVSYYSSQMPFLNLFKAAGNNGVYSPWWTNGTPNTAYLQMDSDGNVTTLVAAAGQGTYTSVYPLVNVNICGGILPPNVTSLYPTGNYRFQFSGPGTMTVSGDAAVPSQTPPTGVTISGNTITSTLAMGSSVSVTLNVASATSAGIRISITSLPNDGVNYLKFISLVESQYAAQYDSGQLFHPLFLAQLSPYSRLRFMDWGCTNDQDIAMNFSPAPGSGATSGTLTSAWNYPSGTYTFLFMTGQALSVTCTFGSTSVSWGTALSSALSSSGHSAMAYYVPWPTWANRPKMSNFSWGSYAGVPHEVKIALCNALGVDCWINIPVSANFIDSTYATNLANLIKSGSGSSIATPMPSFSGLNSGRKVYVEVGNEVWNLGSFPQAGVAYNMDQIYAGANSDYGQWWYGTQVAGVGDAFYSVYGAGFASTVIVSMGMQTATGQGIQFLNSAMNTPGWSGGAAANHHIGAIHAAPYMQLLSGISQAGLDAIAALADPVGAGFALAYTSVYGGVDYSTYGLSTSGYVRGSTDKSMASLITTIRGNGYAWANLPILGYESGEDTAMSGYYTGASINTVFKGMYRDSRMKYLYYDPTHQLSSNPGYLIDLINDGMQDYNLFNDCTSPTANPSTWALNGDEGQIESIFQPLSGSNTPPKYAGVLSWTSGA